MTATLQAKKGRPNYYAVLRYRDETTGKERQKWVSTDIPIKGNNKRRAEARLKEIVSGYADDKIDVGKDVLFTQFIKDWLENLKPSIEGVTYDTYRLIVYNQIVPFYEPKRLRVRDVTSAHIQQYVNFKLESVSPNTVRKHLWNLSKCFDSAAKQKLVAFNPVKGIDMPKKIKYTGAQFYNGEQIERLLAAASGDALEGIILFSVFYGMRRSEVLGLKWDAVDFGNRAFHVRHTVVRVGKTLHKKDSTKNDSSYRTLPMPGMIVKALERIKDKQGRERLLQPNDYADEGYVFTNAGGKLISPNYVTKRFKSLLQKNGLPVIRLHDLRHSTASYLLHLGFNMKEIQMWLGHGDIGTTMNLYAHLDMEAKRNIAGVLSERFAGMET